MTNKTDEYRAKAEHCRQMADQVVSPIDKEMWLQLAADWLSMASTYERLPLPAALVRRARATLVVAIVSNTFTMDRLEAGARRPTCLTLDRS
jgi:hypothetical protein